MEEHKKFFNRLSAENALSAVAEVTGIVRAMRSKLKTPQSKFLLLLTFDITSHNVLNSLLLS